ncbi:MAG: DinB family protein [Ignavibacteriaceae bacterium]
MNLSQLLHQQLHAVYDKKEWFVAVKDALYGLTAEQAEIKIPGEEHSIKELVIHIVYWSEWYLNRYRGIAVVPDDESNEYTFTGESLGEKNINWHSLNERLNKVLAGWENELAVIIDDKLLSNIPDSNETWLNKISNVILHIAYHTGQIVCLRKIQNNWDSRQGVS